MMREELISALEKATGPDRDLDGEIAAAVWGAHTEWEQANYTMDIYLVVHWAPPHPYAGMKEPCPAYTASIDAALTLVPDGARWCVGRYVVPDGEEASEYAARVDGPRFYDAASPAIALCIAALKARASL